MQVKEKITAMRSMMREHIVPSIPPINFMTRFAELSGVNFPHYKYMKSDHADEFMRSGKLKIGTILDFSDTGKHPERIADSLEGARNFVGGSGAGKAIAAGLNCINAYTFCTSKFLSNDIAKEFDANSVIIIENINFYFKLIQNLSAKYGEFICNIGEVFYIDDEEFFTYVDELIESGVKLNDLKNHMPIVARLKQRSFSSQHEIRAVFEPMTLAARIWPHGIPYQRDNDIHIIPGRGIPSLVNADLVPIFEHVPEARAYCRIERI